MEPDNSAAGAGDFSDVMVPEGAATPDSQAGPAASDDVSWLLDQANPPGFVQALEAELPDPAGSFKVARPDFSTLDPDVAKTVVNLRRAYHKESSARAEMERQLAADRAKLEEERAALKVEREKMFSVFKQPTLLEMLKASDETPPDPYKDPGAFAEWKGKQGAQQIVSQLLERLGAASETAQKEAQAAMEAIAERQRIAEVEGFINARPDFAQYADTVEVLIQKHNFTIEEAYDYARVKAGAPPSQPSQPAPVRADPRAAMRIPGPPPAGTNLPPTPQNLDSHALQDWYDQHPGTRERDAREYERTFGFA